MLQQPILRQRHSTRTAIYTPLLHSRRIHRLTKAVSHRAMSFSMHLARCSSTTSTGCQGTIGSSTSTSTSSINNSNGDSINIHSVRDRSRPISNLLNGRFRRYNPTSPFAARQARESLSTFTRPTTLSHHGR